MLLPKAGEHFCTPFAAMTSRLCPRAPWCGPGMLAEPRSKPCTALGPAVGLHAPGRPRAAAAARRGALRPPASLPDAHAACASLHTLLLLLPCCSYVHVLDEAGRRRRLIGPLPAPVQQLTWVGDTLVASTPSALHTWTAGGEADGPVLPSPQPGTSFLRLAASPTAPLLAASCSDKEVRRCCAWLRLPPCSVVPAGPCCRFEAWLGAAAGSRYSKLLPRFSRCSCGGVISSAGL